MRIGYRLAVLWLLVATLAKRPAASYESEEDDDDRYYGSYVESGDSETGYSSSESPSSHRYYSSKSSTPSPSPSSPSSSSTPETSAVSKKVPIAKRRLARELVEEIVVTVPRKSVDGDSTFLKKLAMFRRNLFEDGDRLEKIFDTVLQTGGDAHITTTPIAKWLPVECKVMPLHLRKEKVIHSGRRNTVYEMVDPVTGKKYAYKTFQKPDEYTAEINFNMFSRHPFIAKAICIQPLEEQAGIVFELVDGMSSMAYVRQPTTTPEDLVRISAQLLMAMEYVHWLGFVHADLKPENVMIDRTGNIKVIDFGFAIPLPFFKTNRGTPTTIAPELVQAVSGGVHEGIDWWAYGSTLGIWHGLAVSSSKSRKFVPIRVDRHEGITFGRIPEAFQDDLRQLVHLMLSPNPERRRFNTRKQLDFLKRLPFFRHYRWPEVDLY